MISPTELAAMQATSNSAMDLSIGIWRPTLSQDGQGTVSKSFALHATVNGNLAQPTAGQLENYGYAIADKNAWMVRVPTGTDIKIGDQLRAGAYNLEVQIVLQPQSYQTSMRVIAAELEHS